MEPPYYGRPTEFGDLSPFTLERTEYVGFTRTTVHCYPVTLRGELLGYVWAAAAESADAAGWCPRHGMGAVGFDAGGVWRGRFKRSRDKGMASLAAMRQWVGQPEDPRGGGVAADAEELVLADSNAVRRLTSRRE